MADTKEARYTYAKGRRKTSVATIRLYEGKGELLINDKLIDQVYPSVSDRHDILSPLHTVSKKEDFYFTVKASGGGYKSQAGAIRHALARALAAFDPDFRSSLKSKGFLTRDPRMVERKKTGLRKARKAEQYSKR